MLSSQKAGFRTLKIVMIDDCVVSAVETKRRYCPNKKAAQKDRPYSSRNDFLLFQKKAALLIAEISCLNSVEIDTRWLIIGIPDNGMSPGSLHT